MATKKDLDQLRKDIAKHGFDVRRTKKNHFMVFRPVETEPQPGKKKGTEETVRWVFVTTLPSTPSEYRGLKNSLADLKRAGFVAR